MRYPALQLTLALLITFSVSSCTAVFSDVYATWNYATQTRADATLSADEIDAFPYTAIYVRRGDNPRALVVLGYIDGAGELANYSWVTAESETLVTRHGRLVKTSDLEPELIARTGLANDPLRCIQRQLKRAGFSWLQTGCELQWQSEADLEDTGNPYSVKVTSDFHIGEPEQLVMPFGVVEAIRVTEAQTFHESHAGRQQQLENIFWLEKDGHVVKSIQYFAPEQSPIQMSQVKWVGRDYE